MIDGSIVKSGDSSLVEEIETSGYDKFKKSGTHAMEASNHHE